MHPVCLSYLLTMYLQYNIYYTDKETDESWGHIYNMKNQFWAGLGSRASTVKKKFRADYEQLLRAVFLCFHGQANFSKICILRPREICNPSKESSEKSSFNFEITFISKTI